MKKRDDKLYLDDINLSIDRILEYTCEMSYEDFIVDHKTFDAVIRNFEILGEAAGHISADYKASNPDFPWVEMKAMRNKLIHEYFGVDIDIVWETVVSDIPHLKKLLKK